MKNLQHQNQKKGPTAKQALIDPLVQEFHDCTLDRSTPGSVYTDVLEPSGQTGNELTIEDIR